MNRVVVLLAALALISVGGCAGAAPAAAPAAAPEHGHHHGHQAEGPRGRLVVRADERVRPSLELLAGKFEEAFPGTEVRFAATAADVLVTSDPAAGEGTIVARDPLVAATGDATVRSVADLRRPGTRVTVCCADAGRVAGLHAATVQSDERAAVRAVVTGAADATVAHRSQVVAAGARLRVIEFPEGLAHAELFAFVPRHGVSALSEAFRELICSALAQRIFADAGF